MAFLNFYRNVLKKKIIKKIAKSMYLFNKTKIRQLYEGLNGLGGDKLCPVICARMNVDEDREGEYHAMVNNTY